MPNEPFKYITTWSLIISYSIFFICIVLTVPKWLFLYAACLLTTTSILGTFFIVGPIAGESESPKRALLDDITVHSGPLILFLLIFGIIKTRIVHLKDKYGYIKTGITLLITVLIYFGYNSFKYVYYYDPFTLFLLSMSVYITSYQIYQSLIN